MAGPRRYPSQPHVPVPSYIPPEVTPAPVMPPTAVYIGEGENRHMDVEETIRQIAINLDAIHRATAAPGQITAPQTPIDETALSQYEKKIERTAKWGGWIWGLVSIIALVFTAGVTYAVFMGENATDSEVEEKDRAAIIEHNGGIDPATVDSETHKPVGHHPDMREAIESTKESVKTIEEEVLPPIVESQKKLDKRSEYQFELSRWQSRVNEARRKKKPIPAKPERLDKLETDIALGKY